MGADELHPLSGLSEGGCWLLFERRAFEHGASEKDPTLVAIRKETVRRRGGMPLAAKALGRRAGGGRSGTTRSDDHHHILPATVPEAVLCALLHHHKVHTHTNMNQDAGRAVDCTRSAPVVRRQHTTGGRGSVAVEISSRERPQGPRRRRVAGSDA
ncbi:unnamed protein product [Musa textilis]